MVAAEPGHRLPESGETEASQSATGPQPVEKGLVYIRPKLRDLFFLHNILRCTRNGIFL
jgi:hypothetical protein